MFGFVHQLVTLSVILSFVSVQSTTRDNKLLLFLLDGFRWDYFDQPDVNLTGFRRMIKEGVKAEYLVPDFPSLSFPNYYSIMTGLHSEDHGLVGNFMFDVKHNETFLLGKNQEQYHSYWWDDGEPLWITAEKQGKRAYFYDWRGCEVTIRGVKPTFCKKYPENSYPKLEDLQQSIAEGLQHLSNGSADLVGIFVELPDKYGHKFGPKTPQLNHKLEQIDVEMIKLLDQLETSGLRDDVNIMIFSDHGMTEVRETRVVNITDHVDMNDIRVILEYEANTYIWPNDGKLDKVYGDLVTMDNPHVTVLKKEDIPDRWFYRKHNRISPILLVADLGWYIATPTVPHFVTYPGSGPMQGTHGFDTAENDMRGIFLATGPDISSGVAVKGFANIHIYQMMCYVLGIQPSRHDGQWSAVMGVIVNGPPSDAVSTSASVLVVVIAALVGVNLGGHHSHLSEGYLPAFIEERREITLC